MKRILPIVLRLAVLSGITGLVYAFVARPANLPAPVQNVLTLSTARLNSALSTINQNQLLTKAEEKFTQPQPIIDPENSSQVQGAATSELAQQAQQAINSTVSQVSSELQNLPKKEAAKILRQTCEQIAADLEK